MIKPHFVSKCQPFCPSGCGREHGNTLLRPSRRPTSPPAAFLPPTPNPPSPKRELRACQFTASRPPRLSGSLGVAGNWQALLVRKRKFNCFYVTASSTMFHEIFDQIIILTISSVLLPCLMSTPGAENSTTTQGVTEDRIRVTQQQLQSKRVPF